MDFEKPRKPRIPAINVEREGDPDATKAIQKKK